MFFFSFFSVMDSYFASTSLIYGTRLIVLWDVRRDEQSKINFEKLPKLTKILTIK